MSKLLPFVNDNSPKESIFNKITSQFPDEDDSLCLFLAVLENGVERVEFMWKFLQKRNQANIQYLLNQLSYTKPDDNALIIMRELVKMAPSSYFTPLCDSIPTHKLYVFILALYMRGMYQEYTRLDFNKVKNSGYKTNLKKFIYFSEDGNKAEFKSRYELQAFIIYNIARNNSPRVCASITPDGIPTTPQPDVEGDFDDDIPF